MMLRRVSACFSLPSAVRACAPRLRRRGSTMLLLLRLGTARIKLQPPPQQQQLRDDDHLPMHPQRTQPPPRHRLLATGAASAALCGFRCRCCCLSVRCGDRRCCVL
ncbi:putative mucin TcSMUG S, partial [Trypanosoma cruzi]